MTDDKLKRAKELQAEMDRIKSENDMILEYIFADEVEKDIHQVAPVHLRIKPRWAFFISKLLKNKNSKLFNKELFILTPKDVEALIDIRIKKYHELQEEYMNL